MRLAILSDIHGNLPALEAVAVRLRDVEQVVCLGDVVNYGPWNDECLELLRTLPRLVLLEAIARERHCRKAIVRAQNFALRPWHE